MPRPYNHESLRCGKVPDVIILTRSSTKMVVIGRTADLDNFIDVSQPTKLYKSTWYQFKRMKSTILCTSLGYDSMDDVNTLAQNNRKRRQYFVNLCASGSRIEISCSRDEKPSRKTKRLAWERLFDTAVVTDTYTAIVDAKSGLHITNQRSSDSFYNAQMLMHGRFQVPKCKISAWFITSAGKALKESTRTKSMDH
jgi:hypothetical protein